MVLLFWIYLVLLTLLFVLQWLSIHWEILTLWLSVSIDFLSNSKWDALFYLIAYDHSHADQDGVCDHLRDVPWEDIFKLSVSAAASEFCMCVCNISFIINIRPSLPHFHGFQLFMLLS